MCYFKVKFVNLKKGGSMSKIISFVNSDWIRTKSKPGLKNQKERYSLCPSCKNYKPGEESNCDIQKALAQIEGLDMKVPVFECEHCILRDDVDKSLFECYEHHGNLVMVRKELKGKHAKMCLCHCCISFHPDEPNNCFKAQELFKLCVKHGLVTPVFECPCIIPDSA